MIESSSNQYFNVPVDQMCMWKKSLSWTPQRIITQPCIFPQSSAELFACFSLQHLWFRLDLTATTRCSVGFCGVMGTCKIKASWQGHGEDLRGGLEPYVASSSSLPDPSLGGSGRENTIKILGGGGEKISMGAKGRRRSRRSPSSW